MSLKLLYLFPFARYFQFLENTKKSQNSKIAIGILSLNILEYPMG